MVGTIVAGVDGSREAQKALSWALAEARLRDAHVKVVSAWHVPAAVYGAPGFVPAADPGLGPGFERAAEQAVDEALEALGDEARGVHVDRVTGEGQPAHVLLEAAEGAELLVVGSRGLGGFTGLLLGSVSQQCAQHARCPVVIVPHDQPD